MYTVISYKPTRGSSFEGEVGDTESGAPTAVCNSESTCSEE